LSIFDTKQADACDLRRRVLIKTWPTVFKLQLKSSWRKLQTPTFATKATAFGLHASPNARDRPVRVNFALLNDRAPRLAALRPERCRANHLWRGPAENRGTAVFGKTARGRNEIGFLADRTAGGIRIAGSSQQWGAATQKLAAALLELVAPISTASYGCNRLAVA
jgi:hypothetical protein